MQRDERKSQKRQEGPKRTWTSVSNYRLVVALDCVCSSTLPTNREKESRLSFAKSPKAQNRLAQKHDRSAMSSSPPHIDPLSSFMHLHWHQPSHNSQVRGGSLPIARPNQTNQTNSPYNLPFHMNKQILFPHVTFHIYARNASTKKHSTAQKQEQKNLCAIYVLLLCMFLSTTNVMLCHIVTLLTVCTNQIAPHLLYTHIRSQTPPSAPRQRLG